MTKDNYKGAIEDLDNNKNGVPTFWSAYGRETLHERYHWGTEWQGEVKKGLTKAEAGIEKLSATPAEAATATAAPAPRST